MGKINKMNIETTSCPSQLKITDMGFTDIVGAPADYTILRIGMNQGISRYGEIRDLSNRFYALELKRLILGESPYDIGRIFRKIRQLGGHARQGGGVNGIEAALRDLVGEVYGTPAHQMLGGKCHDSIRTYCDTDVSGEHAGSDTGRVLRSRTDSGYIMLEMDLDVNLLVSVEDALSTLLGYVERMCRLNQEESSFGITDERYTDFMSAPHPPTSPSTTEMGPDYLGGYAKQARDVMGYEIPLVIDHIGHVNYQTCLRLARRLEKPNILWMEDCVPWFHTEQWKALSDHTCVSMCTGEDIFGREASRLLVGNRTVSVIRPDVLVAGGIGETLHIITMVEEKGAAVTVHMVGTPAGCMAAAHVHVAVGNNLLAMEYHAHDADQRDSMAKGSIQPTMDRGWLRLKDRPELGIEELDGEVLVDHINPQRPGLWKSTDERDHKWSHGRIWS